MPSRDIFRPSMTTDASNPGGIHGMRGVRNGMPCPSLPASRGIRKNPGVPPGPDAMCFAAQCASYSRTASRLPVAMPWIIWVSLLSPTVNPWDRSSV